MTTNTTFYAVEVFFSLQSKSGTPILVNEIQGIYTDKDRAIRIARDTAENYYTPKFTAEAINDVVVRELPIKDGELRDAPDTDIWSAAAERILAWQKPDLLCATLTAIFA